MEDLSRINLRLTPDEQKEMEEVVRAVRRECGFKIPLAVIVKAIMGMRKLRALKPEFRAFLTERDKDEPELKPLEIKPRHVSPDEVTRKRGSRA